MESRWFISLFKRAGQWVPSRARWKQFTQTHRVSTYAYVFWTVYVFHVLWLKFVGPIAFLDAVYKG
jgi:hypothetical protein